MTQAAAIADVLAALGHEVRLSLFRLLVKAGEDGLNVGDLKAHMRLPASTLAYHLSTLVAVGLVVQERRGREVVSRADYDTMNRAIRFLTDQCCMGVILVQEEAA